MDDRRSGPIPQASKRIPDLRKLRGQVACGRMAGGNRLLWCGLGEVTGRKL